MMLNHPMPSVLYTSLLLGQGTAYRSQTWTASDGSIRCSVDFTPGDGRCGIQGQPAALRELAEALLAAVDAAERADPANPANEGVAG